MSCGKKKREVVVRVQSCGWLVCSFMFGPCFVKQSVHQKVDCFFFLTGDSI